MEPKVRNLLIVVVVLLVAACCCILAVGAAGVGFFAVQAPTIGSFGLGDRFQERTEWTFEVGDVPVLDITNFAGSVTVQSGNVDTIYVVAVKKAATGDNLDRLRIAVTERGSSDDPVVIETNRPFSSGSASVEMEITAPPGTQLKVDTGAGNVTVAGLNGPVDVHSGAGTIDMHDLRGSAKARLGAGNIDYEGIPAGDCSFESGAGNVTLNLPIDLNMQVQVSTGAGIVAVPYHVDGRVSKQSVSGVVGDGSQGTIYAHTGAGNVNLVTR